MGNRKNGALDVSLKTTQQRIRSSHGEFGALRAHAHALIKTIGAAVKVLKLENKAFLCV